MNALLVWLSGFLFAAGGWQLEIVSLRREHDEPYSLPFFVVTSRRYSLWGDVWMAMIFVSFLLIISAFTIF
jgi:hypothetical protein